MKRLLLILILLLPQLLAAQSADRSAAQTADRIPANSAGRRTGREYAIRTVDRDSLGLDTLRRLDAMGGELMSLRGDGREGSVVLEVAGFGLTLGRAPETDSQADLVMRSGRVKLYFFNSGEFGFTKLVGVDGNSDPAYLQAVQTFSGLGDRLFRFRDRADVAPQETARGVRAVGTANLSVRCRRNGFLLRHRHLRQLRRDPAVQEACGTGVPYVQFRHLAAHVTKYERT